MMTITEGMNVHFMALGFERVHLNNKCYETPMPSAKPGAHRRMIKFLQNKILCALCAFARKLKQMKEATKKQLKYYSTMAVAVLAVNTDLQAGIEYTDIVPDATLSQNFDTLALDVNNDGTNDFAFRFRSQSANTSYGYFLNWNNLDIDPFGNNEVLSVRSVVHTYTTWGYLQHSSNYIAHRPVFDNNSTLQPRSVRSLIP